MRVTEKVLRHRVEPAEQLNLRCVTPCCSPSDVMELDKENTFIQLFCKASEVVEMETTSF
jgi:hypothetical protein